jgi:hypothetical protein
MVRHTGKDFIDVEGIAVTLVLSFQAAGIDSTELDAPRTDRVAGDGNAALGKYALPPGPC